MDCWGIYQFSSRGIHFALKLTLVFIYNLCNFSEELNLKVKRLLVRKGFLPPEFTPLSPLFQSLP